MFDKNIIIRTITQLWLFQFVFYFIDIYSKFNIDAFFPFLSYIILINIFMLICILFYKLSYFKRIGFLLFGLLFLFFGFLGVFTPYLLFDSSIWFINFAFVIFFVVFNKYRKFILSLFDVEVKLNLTIFISLLFLLQFVFLNLAYSIIVTVLFGLYMWYLYGDFIIAKFFKKSKFKVKKESKNIDLDVKKEKIVVDNKVLKDVVVVGSVDKILNKKISILFLVNFFLVVVLIGGIVNNFFYFVVSSIMFIIIFYFYFSKSEAFFIIKNNINNDKI